MAEKNPNSGSPTIDEVLTQIYYHSKGEGAYGTAEKLYRKGKLVLPSLTLKQTRHWLDGQIAYSRHRQPRKFVRRKTLFLRIDGTWTLDLIETSAVLWGSNNRKKFILNCVDCFSRFCWLKSLYSKRAKEVEDALREIIAENGGRPPRKAWVDQGKEFELPVLWDELDIVKYSTKSPDIKATIVERVNKDIETILYKIMSSRSSSKYIDKLDDAAAIHNNSVHSSLHGLTPAQAHDPKNEEYLRAKFLQDYERFKDKIRSKPPKFKVGQQVRIKNKRTIFERGYEPRYQREVEKIEAVIPSFPYRFRIKGRDYYAGELVEARKAETEQEKKYFIAQTKTVGAKTLRSGHTSGGEKLFLLRSLNDADQSSWINAYEYSKLKDGGLIVEGIH